MDLLGCGSTLRPCRRAGTASVHDRADLRHPLRRAVLRAEPDGAGDHRDQRPRPRRRHLLGRPDHLRLQAGVRAAQGYLDRIECETIVVIPGNHDSRNVGYVHFEELFGERNSVLRRGGVTVVAVDSTEPDLDHGQIGRGRYRWIEEQFAGRRRPEDLRPAPPPAAGPGHRPRAQHRLRRRRRARVPAARGRRPRALGPQARAVRVAARGPVRRQRRHGLLARACGATTRPCYNMSRSPGTHVDVWRKYPFHGQERIIQFSTETRAFEKYTARIEDEVTREDVMRALAIVDGEHYAPVVRDALAALPYEVVGALAGRRHGEAARRRGLRRPGRRLARGRDRRARAGARGRPLRRAGARAARALPASPAACSRSGCRTSAPTSASTRRRSRRSRCRRSASSAPASASARPPSPGHVARLLARDRDVVVVAMGRGGPPEPEVVEVRADARRAARALARRAARGLRLPRDGGARRRRRRSAAGAAAAGWRARPATSNVLEGAALAAEREPGARRSSTAAARRSRRSQTDARVLVTSARQPREVVTGYLNAYRILVSDLVVVTGGLDEELVEAIHQVKELPVVSVELRPRPVEPVLGRRVAFFTTAPPRRTRRSSGTCARARRRGRARLGQPRAPRGAARRTSRARSTPTSTSSRSRRPRSTSSPRRRSSAGCEVVFADNELVPVGELDLDRS